MGYLDNAGLQYLWGKLKEKFAPKSHIHDDRYYTEAEVNSKLSGKVDNTEAGANGLFSKLGIWTATPTDDTYFMRQDTGGTNQFGRVKFSTIWNYIKGKADGTYQPKGNYAASGHTHDDRYYTESEMNAKLSKKAENIVLASDTNLNNITTPGFYSCGGGNKITNKPNNIDAIGLIVTHNASGNYYTQILTTSSNANTYRRTCLNGSWSGWTQDKYTDTNTWRGIQNNLTSDSTSDSLSAAQGKVLKGLVDGKANSSHTHTKSQITDFPTSLKNPTALTIQTNGAIAATYDGSAAKTVNITKGNIGLGNVDNTADANKSVKYATSAGSANTATKATAADSATTAITSKSLQLLSSVRPTSMNFNLAGADYLGKVTYQIASSSTTTGKPPRDSGVLNFSWDNSGWGAQVAVENNNNPRIHVRGATSNNGSSKWDTSWKTVAFTDDKPATAGTADKANSVDWSKVQNKPSSYPPSSHTHDDRYYTEAEVNIKLNGKSNTGHTHDDRYYTESEVETKLKWKADINHIHLNGTKTGAIDWNTFTTYGVYKIQNCTMDNARHAPPDEYAFGILQVLDSENNGGEKRIIQIYWPHSTAKGNHLWYRMHNSSDINAGWSGWTQIKKKPDTAGYADSAGSVAWGNVSGKPSSYPPSSHTHAYLPTGGGTMTGNITFSDIGNTNTSNKISWNGSTDGADIYYQTTAGDQGNLVLNLRDDSNCYLRIAKNGTFKSYFSPDDGNFHGNVNGNVIGNVSGSSGSCTGNAATATKATLANKLTTARTVSGGTDIRLNFNYDGSGNSSASIGYYSCTGTVGNTNNYPWHRFASYGPFSGAWNDAATLFYIAQDYNGGGFGIFRICLRTNANSGSMSCEVRWLVRSGISADQVQIHYCPNESSAYADAFFKTQGTYAGFTMRAIASGRRAGIGSTWKLISSIEANGTTTSNKGSSSECWASIASAGTALHNKAYTGSTVGYDNGGVSSASLATTAAKLGRNGNTGAPMTFHWNGQGGQPTWLWGSNDGSNIYVWNPSNFSVNYAKSAGSVAWGNVSGKPSSYPPASHSHAYLPLGGGTMTGQIKRGVGSSWINDRDNAIVYGTSSGTGSGYHPVVGQKTPSGAWTIGTYGDERLIFDYTKDTDKNAGTNNGTQVYLPAQAGTIITSATIGNQTVNRAEYLSNESAYMRMHWSGQSGQPSWLWGGNDASNMYVYNPSNFSVNYAATAGNGVYSSNINIWGNEGYIRFKDGIQICWGTSTSGSASGSFTFPQRFVYQPCIMISGTGAYRYAFYVTKSENYRFSYYRDGSGTTASPQYVAIGNWDNSSL